MTHNENGPKWARGGLILGVIASVVGNVANAFLTETPVSILLRAPLAVVWPAFLFVAVEVLVRNRGSRGPLARLGQAALLTVTVPTAITSFLNLHALMVKANEPGMAQLTGPLAIDGVMLGCTIMLLAVRVRDTGQGSGTVDNASLSPDNAAVSTVPAPVPPAVSTVPAPVPLSAPLDTPTAAELEDMFSLSDFLPQPTGPVPSPLPVPVSAPPASDRVVRVLAPSEMDAAVEGLLAAGVPVSEVKATVAEVYGVSTKTVGRRIAGLSA